MHKPKFNAMPQQQKKLNQANQRQVIGRLGEEIAKKYLKKKGCKILDQHYCARGGEIDLVVSKRDVLIFVEVKTRTSDKCGFPEEAINYFKQKRLVNAFQNYLYKRKVKSPNYRFDIISVKLNNTHQPPEIKHFENVTIDSGDYFL